MLQESCECTDYELFSVVIHRGGAHGGHYHAIIKDVDHLGNWSLPVCHLLILFLNFLTCILCYIYPVVDSILPSTASRNFRLGTTIAGYGM